VSDDKRASIVLCSPRSSTFSEAIDALGIGTGSADVLTSPTDPNPITLEAPPEVDSGSLLLVALVATAVNLADGGNFNDDVLAVVAVFFVAPGGRALQRFEESMTTLLNAFVISPNAVRFTGWCSPFIGEPILFTALEPAPLALLTRVVSAIVCFVWRLVTGIFLYQVRTTKSQTIRTE
jgi:hypothetical protein